MEPRDLLKKLHPNQFSDSKIIDKIECPRELLDFHLSKLSKQNKHFDFEDFIRDLLETDILFKLLANILAVNFIFVYSTKKRRN